MGSAVATSFAEEDLEADVDCVDDGGHETNNEGDVHGSTSATAAAGSAKTADRKCKYPRVDPPEVEDDPGQAISGDTRYIARSFPNCFSARRW